MTQNETFSKDGKIILTCVRNPLFAKNFTLCHNDYDFGTLFARSKTTSSGAFYDFHCKFISKKT